MSSLLYWKVISGRRKIKRRQPKRTKKKRNNEKVIKGIMFENELFILKQNGHID